MQWIAPSERDTNTDSLENRLWAAADQLRANPGLTPAQYSQPVLGLIFLRFAEVKFLAQRAVLPKTNQLVNGVALLKDLQMKVSEIPAAEGRRFGASVIALGTASPIKMSTESDHAQRTAHDDVCASAHR